MKRKWQDGQPANWKKERIKKMKKKVMCMLLTGMMAASMIAGCGNSGNASANAGAVTNTDAGTDTSGAADNSTDQSADVTPDTTAASAAAESSDFDNSEYINVVSREDGSVQEEHSSSCSVWKRKMMPVRKLIIQPMKQSSQTVPTLC